jgi:MerR family transcriptional regulator/heat shock protein HspR
MKRKARTYTISAVADQYEIHPQTLRLYEREGLLKPSRSEGNTRLYTDSDLERLEVILSLTRDLGVNLAGVEIILNMREKMDAMHREFELTPKSLQTLRMRLLRPKPVRSSPPRTPQSFACAAARLPAGKIPFFNSLCLLCAEC